MVVVVMCRCVGIRSALLSVRVTDTSDDDDDDEDGVLACWNEFDTTVCETDRHLPDNLVLR